MATIGDRLKALAQAKGQSMRALAVDSEIDPKTFHRYVKGRVPPADALARIALATGASSRWLLLGAGEMFEPQTFEQRLEMMASARALSREYVVRLIAETESTGRLAGVLVGLYDAAEHLPDPFVASSIRRLLHIAAVRDKAAVGAVMDALRQHDPGAEKAGLLASSREPSKSPI